MRLTLLVESWYLEWAKQGEEPLNPEFSLTEARLHLGMISVIGTQQAYAQRRRFILPGTDCV